MPQAEVGMVRYLAHEALGAEHRRHQHIPHRMRQLDALRRTGPIRAVEMHGQVELAGKFDRRLGNSLPAFDVAAGIRGPGEVDQNANLKRQTRSRLLEER